MAYPPSNLQKEVYTNYNSRSLDTQYMFSCPTYSHGE